MSHPQLAGLELSWALHVVSAQQPVLEQSRHGRRMNRQRRMPCTPQHLQV